MVKSISDPESGLLGADLTHGDLTQFKARLDKHIEEFNDALEEEDDDDPICIMLPWIEKGKIIVMPASEETGNNVINMINTSVRLTGHKIIAGWNTDLPMAATVSVRFESVTKRDPKMVIEDPKKGIARLNKWKLSGREIAFQGVTSDPANPDIVFAQVSMSKRICELIQQQRGLVWIHGGQATVQWKGKDLVEGLTVHYHLQ